MPSSPTWPSCRLYQPRSTAAPLAWLALPARGSTPELRRLLLGLQPRPLREDLITDHIVGFVQVVFAHHPDPDLLVGSQFPVNGFAVVCKQNKNLV